MQMPTIMPARASCAIIRKSLPNAADEERMGYAADLYRACWEPPDNQRERMLTALRNDVVQELVRLGVRWWRALVARFFASVPYPERLWHGERLGNMSKCLKTLVPQEGFEPPTPSLRMTCSTN